jgi:hypothetical protein
MAFRIIPLKEVFIEVLNVAQVYSILLLYLIFLPNVLGKVDQNLKKKEKEGFECDLKSFDSQVML